MRGNGLWSLIFLFLYLLASCGTAQDGGVRSAAKKVLSSETTSDKVSVSIELAYDSTQFDAGAYGLQNATSFIFEVLGCKSGYTITNHDTSTDGTTFKLYKGDQSCVAGLKSFVWSSKTWTKVGGGSYTGTAAVTFENGTDSQTVEVLLAQNLPDPLSSDVTLSFYFHMITSGTSKQIVTTSSPNFVGGLTSDAPYYRLTSSTGVVLTNIQSPSNIATFTFHLECENATTSSNTICPTVGNNNQNQDTMRVTLLKDTFGGTFATWDDVHNAFDSAASIVSINSGDFDAQGSGFNGGFSIDLDGPEDLTTSRKMVLIIEYNDAVQAERSYTYFTVNFAGGS